ncbi:membrane protein implicated in regulation of membrane protease activity [Metabacillus crassostreae]|uniref:SA1362 family protein n=1 Tax=Metabacillus crassostreae TaxID=929098 RepID=UPI00195A963C|nr:SA1362 family protein [Metabacillus crassostreae]MBM7604608.1 membrane protein implicated in regulation of membrane protease activity [Metabacillus crassostreae]
MNRRMNGFVLVIISLGIIGVITTLVSDPLWLLKQIAIYAVLAGAIYLIYRLFMKKRMGKENTSYAKAVKQSKKRYDDRNTRGSNIKNISQVKRSSKTSTIKKKKQPSHLTVIEGKKGKKKNRAFF